MVIKWKKILCKDLSPSCISTKKLRWKETLMGDNKQYSIMPCGLRRRSVSAWLLGSRVRIPLGSWTFVSCVVQVAASAKRWSLVKNSPIGCVSHSVWSGNLNNENAWARLGLLHPKIYEGESNENLKYLYIITCILFKVFIRISLVCIYIYIYIYVCVCVCVCVWCVCVCGLILYNLFKERAEITVISFTYFPCSK